MACITVSQFELERVLDNGPPPENFDVNGSGRVDIVSIDLEEG